MCKSEILSIALRSKERVRMYQERSMGLSKSRPISTYDSVSFLDLQYECRMYDVQTRK